MAAQTQMTTYISSASIIAFTLIYAVCFAAIKAGLAFAPALRYGGLRAFIGGAALLGIVIAMHRPLLPARRSWPWLLALALFSTTIGFGAMFLSPGRTGAGIASVLGNMQPLFALVLAGLFLGERITRGKAVALALGLGGVTLISYPVLASSYAYGLSGVLLVLAASAGTSACSVIVKRMDRGRDLLSVAARQLILGSLPLLGLSALVEGASSILGIVWTVRLFAHIVPGPATGGDSGQGLIVVGSPRHVQIRARCVVGRNGLLHIGSLQRRKICTSATRWNDSCRKVHPSRYRPPR